MYSGLTDSIWRGAGLKEATLLLNGSAVTAELASLSISGSVNGDQEEVAVGAALCPDGDHPILRSPERIFRRPAQSERCGRGRDAAGGDLPGH